MLRRCRIDPAVHIPRVEAVGRIRDHQVRRSLVDQGILLPNADLEIALDQLAADYKACSRLVVEQDKRAYFVEAVGIGLVVHGMDTGHTQFGAAFDTVGSAGRKVPAGVKSRRKYSTVHRSCGVAVRSYRMKCQYAQLSSIPRYLGSLDRTPGQNSLGCQV